ncbi:hypothetical protein VNO77_11089 [Canavalia gladiata]|uniref:Uncharacterized protein n=1 Tax=Canavalia gladiata TaxID=3824 RepID=A0AAN9MGL0_CANGL
MKERAHKHSETEDSFHEGISEVMENGSSPRSRSDGGWLSCWGRVKLKFPWAKRTSSYKPAGGFRYDPLSYAQNFDEGWMEDDEESLYRGFSARYAAPSAKSFKQ